MFTPLIWLLFFLLIIALFQAPMRRLGGQRVIELPPAQALPDELVEDFKELVFTVTESGLELLKDYKEVQELVQKAARQQDGFIAADAKKKLALATTSAETILQATTDLYQSYADLPDEAADWLEHNIEVSEVCIDLASEEHGLFDSSDLDRVERYLDATIDRVETLLLAANDFSRRMLNYDLADHIAQTQGPKRRRFFIETVRAANQRYMQKG